MPPILEIQNISKKYSIQHLNGGYLSFRERMLTAVQFKKQRVDDFWALNNVSFEVNTGESIGIIGRNGAGKSTLLKILSKITPPTSGRIVSRGRIASLLEVGTGFHPELTGRENIFFNGSLLGMKRKEIESKFDEIVDFSGVEKFLDTPLKHYSSGMQLRLAFAVAAFLEPEILIIDEVLAVGDAEFQKKCLRKMEDVTSQGRTILFVSHNLLAIRSFCKKIVWLEKGKVAEQGDETLLEKYIYETASKANVSGNGSLVLNDIVSITEFSLHQDRINQYHDLTFYLRLNSSSVNKIHELALLIYNQYEERISVFDLRTQHMPTTTSEKVEVCIRGIIESLPLVPGNYFVSMYINSSAFVGNTKSLAGFTILDQNQNSDVVSYPIASRGFLDLKGKFVYE